VRSTPLIRALVVTAALRLLYSYFAFAIGRHLNPDPAWVGANHLTERLMDSRDGWRFLWLGIWERFDTLWYLHIARSGYDRPAATVFYPLYPVLIRALTWLTREPIAAALIISTLAAFFLFWGLQELALLDSPDECVSTLLIAAAWPVSFVFFAAYADSLMIALVVWSAYFARRERWGAAAILAMLAGLTKAAGGLACIPLAFAVVRSRNWRALPALGISLLGSISYAIWLKVSGFPPSPEVYSAYWRTTTGWPWNTLAGSLREWVQRGDSTVGLNLTVILLFAALTLVGWRMKAGYSVFSCAALGMFLTKRSVPLLESSSRYVLLIFPVFLVLGELLRRPMVLSAVMALIFPLNLVLLKLFLEWRLVI
jgi:hypothetical protein